MLVLFCPAIHHKKFYYFRVSLSLIYKIFIWRVRSQSTQWDLTSTWKNFFFQNWLSLSLCSSFFSFQSNKIYSWSASYSKANSLIAKRRQIKLFLTLINLMTSLIHFLSKNDSEYLAPKLENLSTKQIYQSCSLDQAGSDSEKFSH